MTLASAKSLWQEVTCPQESVVIAPPGIVILESTNLLKSDAAFFDSSDKEIQLQMFI